MVGVGGTEAGEDEGTEGDHIRVLEENGLAEGGRWRKSRVEHADEARRIEGVEPELEEWCALP